MSKMANRIYTAALFCTITLFLLVPVNPAIAQGAGECPTGLTKEKIDDLATRIGLSSLAEVDLDNLVCINEVDSTGSIAATIAAHCITTASCGVFEAFEVVITASKFSANNYGSLRAQMNGKSNVIAERVGGVVSTANALDVFVCKAELLRSFTWRRLCAGKPR